MSRAVAAGACAAITLLALAFAGCGALREQNPTPTATVVHVSANQIAQAMAEDRFFSDYGHSTLLVDGTVLSVTRQDDDLIIELGTSAPNRVLCDIGNQVTSVSPGDTITVQAPSNDARRQGSAVLLRSCSMQ